MPVGGPDRLGDRLNGFLGRAVCDAALAAGGSVHALHRRPADPHDRRRLAGRWLADLTDHAATLAALTNVRPDVVVHAAGHASAVRNPAAVHNTLHDNLVATVNLLSACREGGVRRVVLAGSLECPTGDASAVVPSSPYAASKFAESVYGRMFHRLYGLGVVEARLAIVYGPGTQRPGKLIPYIVERLSAVEPAELTSGRRRIDWVYLDDAAAGLLACAVAPAAAEGTGVDVGSGSPVTVADLAGRIATLMGRPDLLRFGALIDRPDEGEWSADVERTHRLTGWRPAVGLDEGLERTVAALRQ